MTNKSYTHRFPDQVQSALLENDIQKIKKLSEQYSQGKGVKKNNKIALTLFLAGARLGDAESAWYAADAFEYGLGTLKSQENVEKYLKLASRLGSLGATTALGQLYWSRAASEADRRKAIALYKRAGRGGEPHALHNIGVCYSSGVGVRKNLSLAFKYFLRAAESGHVEAAFKVGWCYLHGEGVKVDFAASQLWLQYAAVSGSRDAKRLLARIGRNSVAPSAE